MKINDPNLFIEINESSLTFVTLRFNENQVIEAIEQNKVENNLFDKNKFLNIDEIQIIIKNNENMTTFVARKRRTDSNQTHHLNDANNAHNPEVISIKITFAVFARPRVFNYCQDHVESYLHHGRDYNEDVKVVPHHHICVPNEKTFSICNNLQH